MAVFNYIDRDGKGYDHYCRSDAIADLLVAKHQEIDATNDEIDELQDEFDWLKSSNINGCNNTEQAKVRDKLLKTYDKTISIRKQCISIINKDSKIPLFKPLSKKRAIKL